MTMKNVLLIGSDSDVSKYIYDLFKFHFNNVVLTTFENGKDGLNYLNKSFVDLLILDTQLADCDGDEILIAMNAIDRVPVIIISGIDNEEFILKLRLLDVDAYITKPIEKDIFLTVIKTMLINYKG